MKPCQVGKALILGGFLFSFARTIPILQYPASVSDSPPSNMMLSQKSINVDG
jgi:hypothetical protein